MNQPVEIGAQAPVFAVGDRVRLTRETIELLKIDRRFGVTRIVEAIEDTNPRLGHPQSITLDKAVISLPGAGNLVGGVLVLNGAHFERP